MRCEDVVQEVNIKLCYIRAVELGKHAALVNADTISAARL